MIFKEFLLIIEKKKKKKKDKKRIKKTPEGLAYHSGAFPSRRGLGGGWIWGAWGGDSHGSSDLGGGFTDGSGGNGGGDGGGGGGNGGGGGE